MSNFKFEQRCTIKFCFKLGINATETCGKLKLKEAYEEDALYEPKFSDGSRNFQRVEIRLKMSLERVDQQHQKLM